MSSSTASDVIKAKDLRNCSECFLTCMVMTHCVFPISQVSAKIQAYCNQVLQGSQQRGAASHPFAQPHIAHVLARILGQNFMQQPPSVQRWATGSGVNNSQCLNFNNFFISETISKFNTSSERRRYATAEYSIIIVIVTSLASQRSTNSKVSNSICIHLSKWVGVTSIVLLQWNNFLKLILLH